MDDPVFPRELEREIFETMALMHPGKIPTLLRVARRVLFWIEPLLFRVISVTPENSEIVPALLKAMDCKPPAFFHGVRHIMLPVEYSDDKFTREDSQRLLKLCNRPISFACDFDDTYTGPNLLPILAELRPQRLLVRPRFLFGTTVLDLQHRPLFHSVTHLDLIGLTGVGDVLGQVPTLTTLTHLSVSHASARRRALAVLGKCPHLMLLLFKVISTAPRAEREEYIPHVYDVRFVIGTYPSRWTDWQAGAKGLPDSWVQADDFVARKRRGEIEATRYWMN
ncbi:hypothetical protein DFH06DRAFT_1244232 [Mycena polygramma]|nr:hypothetical protein DFH06DRAFT_1244232 [Mycena polygramma]